MIVKLNLREMFNKRRESRSGKKESAQVGGGQIVSEGARLREFSWILSVKKRKKWLRERESNSSKYIA